MFLKILPIVGVPLIAIASASVASADPVFADFTAPSTFGQPNTTYAEWGNGFTSLTSNAPSNSSAIAPDTAPIGSANAYDSTSASDGAFFTSGTPHHIYSYSGKITPTITLPEQNLGSSYATTIIAQIATMGNPPDLTKVTLQGADGTSATYDEEQLSVDATQGYNNYQFEWTVPGNASSYTITVPASATSMSFAAARVDVAVLPAAVPEPMSIGAAALAGVGLISRRRRLR